MTAPSGPFGAAFEAPPSLTSTLIVDPTVGFDVSHPGTNLPLGATPNSDNFVMREGALEPRPMLKAFPSGTTLAAPMASRVLGGLDVVDVSGVHYPMVSGLTRLAAYNLGSWSLASYISTYGLSDPPAGAQTDYWDWTQIFYDQPQENIAVGAVGSRQSLYCWRPGATVFSTLTGAPGAKTVCAFDSFLVAGNVRVPSGTFVQRVMWCDRGSASSWTGGLSGFIDMLDAPGELLRLLPLESRVIAFFPGQIWQIQRQEYPITFQAYPLDSTIGCPYPWTATVTPRGIVFMGRDFQLYLLPKDGGQAQPVGQPLHRAVRNTIRFPEGAFGLWDGPGNRYHFYYSTGSSTNSLPEHAAYLQLESGAWAPQSFGRVTSTASLYVTRGFPIFASGSTGSTWSDLSTSGVTWGGLQAQGKVWTDYYNPRLTSQLFLLGSSAGTLYSLDSTVTSDDGTPVQSFWESSHLDGNLPPAQKTVVQVRLDYQADTDSNVTVRLSPSQGVAFQAGSATTLPAVSTISQAIVDTYVPSRYPVVRIESQGYRYRLERLHVTRRIGGR